MESKREEKPCCSHCGSSQTYVRIKTKDRCCRLCGKISPLTGDSDVETGKKE